MADDPNITSLNKELEKNSGEYRSLEGQIGSTTEAGKKWIKSIEKNLPRLKQNRDSVSAQILQFSIEKSEIANYAHWAHEISEKLAKNPEDTNFKLMFYILKKSYEFISFEKIAPTVQNSVNSWMNSLEKKLEKKPENLDDEPDERQISLMDFLFESEGNQPIYLAWPQYFREFEYKPGSEKESEAYFNPKTWAGVREAFYQESAWRSVYLDQLYSTLLYLQNAISTQEQQFNAGSPYKGDLEQFQKDLEANRELRKNLDKQIADYQNIVNDYMKRLGIDHGQYKGSYETLEAEIRTMAYNASKDMANRANNSKEVDNLIANARRPYSQQRPSGGMQIGITNVPPRHYAGEIDNYAFGLYDYMRDPLLGAGQIWGSIKGTFNSAQQQAYSELKKEGLSDEDAISRITAEPEEFRKLGNSQKDLAKKLLSDNPGLSTLQAIELVNEIYKFPEFIKFSKEERDTFLNFVSKNKIPVSQAMELALQAVAPPVVPIEIKDGGGVLPSVPIASRRSESHIPSSNTGQEYRSAEMGSFMRRSGGLRGQYDNRDLFGWAKRFAGALETNIRGTSTPPQPQTPPALERAMNRETGFLGGIRKSISNSRFFSQRNAISKQAAGKAGAALAGNAAKTTAVAGAEKAGAAALGGPVGIVFAVGSFLLSKENRERLQHFIVRTFQVVGAGLYVIFQGAIHVLAEVLGPLAPAFGLGGAAFGLTAQSAFAAAPATTATSLGSAAGFVGGAGFGTTGGGLGASGSIGTAAPPLIAVGCTAAIAVITCAVIIPAAFAQPSGPVGQQGKSALTVQKTADPSYLPDYNGELTTINYKFKISLADNNIHIDKITDKKTLQKDSGDVDKGETVIDSGNLKVDSNGDLIFDYTYDISGEEFKNSTLLNTITVEATDNNKAGPANKITQSSSFIVWINKKPVHQPYGFPAPGTIFSLDWHFGSVPANQGVHWSCFFVIKPVVCGADGQTDITGHSAILGGADISGPAGTPVKSTLDGKVIGTEWRTKDIGGAIYIRSCNDFPTCDDKNLGQYVAEFEHLNEPAVKVGDIISRGTDIGSTTTKESAPVITGPHVHYQVILVTSESNGEITGGSNVNFTDPNNAGLCSEGKIEPSFDEDPSFKQAIFNYPNSGFPSVPGQYIIPTCK